MLLYKRQEQGVAMKLLTSIVFSIVLLALPVFAQAADPEGTIFLRLIEGDVQMKMADSTEWVPAAANTPLYQGDRIWVPDDGRAEVRFQNGSTVRLGAGTALELGQADSANLLLYLDEGRAWVHSSASGQPPVTISTPAASFTGDPGSVYRVEVVPNGATSASALAGNVYADQQSGEMQIRAGERLYLAQGAQYPQLSGIGPEDEWGRWNRARDQEIYAVAQGPSNRYLPDELSAYAPDFDANGRWENVPEYGYVWTPTVVTAADWAPYRAGRWVWIRNDYVWIPSERWGWAPHHYGRWANIRGRWCWIPPGRGAAYWGPGYVGWVNTPTHVSWVPLAPRETYYGRGNRGPYTVNVTRINVQKTVINGSAFRNIHVANAVTTLKRDAFLAGRTGASRVRENLFLTQHPSVGAPHLKPIHATVMPAVKQIPAAKRPPERVVQAHATGPRPFIGRPVSPAIPMQKALPAQVTHDNQRMKDAGRGNQTPQATAHDAKTSSAPNRPPISTSSADGQGRIQPQRQAVSNAAPGPRPQVPPTAAPRPEMQAPTRYTNQDVAARRPSAQADRHPAPNPQQPATSIQPQLTKEPMRTQPQIAQPATPVKPVTAPPPSTNKAPERVAAGVVPPERSRQAVPTPGPDRGREASMRRPEVVPQAKPPARPDGNRPGQVPNAQVAEQRRVVPSPQPRAVAKPDMSRPMEAPKAQPVEQRRAAPPPPAPAPQPARVTPPPRPQAPPEARQAQKAAPVNHQPPQARADKPAPRRESKSGPAPKEQGRPGHQGA